MSSHTEAEPVPFKINVYSGNYSADNPTRFPALNVLLHYLNKTVYEYEAGSKRGEQLPEFQENGWKLNPDSEYGRLLTDKLTKDGHEVHYVNENEAVGAEDICFFSDKQESLEKFCEDWCFDKTKIETGKAVKQTL
jgi:hypothetical protein